MDIHNLKIVKMKTKKSLEEVAKPAAIISMSGFAVFIVLSVVDTFFTKIGSTLDFTACVGALIFMMPFFALQFVMPAGLLDTKDIPFWGKLMFYALAFPFANIWMLSSLDSMFHFLPDFHAAMSHGDMILSQALRQQWQQQGWAIMGATYVVMIGGGIIFKGIFGNRLRAKIA